MTGVSVRLEGGASINALLSGLVLDAEKRTDLLGELGDTVLTQTALRFVDGVGPDGDAWPVSIRAATQGGQTLLDKRRLSASITKEVSPGTVEVGTNVDYALPNQFGATINARAGEFLTFKIGDRWSRKRQVVIPPRPFLGINESDQAEIGETVVAWLDAIVRRAAA